MPARSPVAHEDDDRQPHRAEARPAPARMRTRAWPLTTTKPGRQTTVRHRDAGQRRRGDRGRDARHDLERHAGPRQAGASSPPRPSTNGSPALSRTTRWPRRRRVNHQVGYRRLGQGLSTGAPRDRHVFGGRGELRELLAAPARRTARGRRPAAAESRARSEAPDRPDRRRRARRTRAPTAGRRVTSSRHRAPRVLRPTSRSVGSSRIKRLDQLRAPRLHRHTGRIATRASAHPRGGTTRRDPAAASHRAPRAAARRAPAPGRSWKSQSRRRRGAARRRDTRSRSAGSSTAFTKRRRRSALVATARFTSGVAAATTSHCPSRSAVSKPRSTIRTPVSRIGPHTAGATTVTSAPAARSAAILLAATTPPPTTSTGRSASFRKMGNSSAPPRSSHKRPRTVAGPREPID